MVMSKTGYTEMQAGQQAQPKQDKWHKADGTLNAKGTTLKNRVLAFLEDAKNYDKDFAYAAIREEIVAKFPDAYTSTEGGIDIKDAQGQVTGKREILANRDIKSISAELVKEDKVVDI
jgi:hypothetical protein